MGIPCGGWFGPSTHSYGLTKRQAIDQAACKPGSVQHSCECLCGHSSGMDLAVHLARPTRTERSGTPVLFRGRPSLFGLAPGGACHAVSVTGHAVGSYPTLSPLPRTCRGGLLSVALSRSSPFPLQVPARRADVIRRLAIVEPGLSSNGLPHPRPPGHLIDVSIIAHCRSRCSSPATD
jgi:hypothetical protein